MSDLLASPKHVFSAAIILRVVLLFYGLLQDAYSPIKYTDIDYYVFTDASRFTAQGGSPYDRDTYRYTPLLAWLLVPTTWYSWSFSLGKVAFAIGDLVAGWLIWLTLRSTPGMSSERALKFACIWLLNPMVATISTRGSSEGLLGVMVMVILWAITRGYVKLAGAVLGLGVHFKIYPFIYAASIVWRLDDSSLRSLKQSSKSSKITQRIVTFMNPDRISLVLTSMGVFSILNFGMWLM